MGNATRTAPWIRLPAITRSRPEFLAHLRCVIEEDPKSISFQMKGTLLGRTDRHELLRTIRGVPVLVIAGEEDRQFPVHIVRKAARAIDGSRFVVLEETGHLASLERPDLVNAEIDRFLTSI